MLIVGIRLPIASLASRGLCNHFHHVLGNGSTDFFIVLLSKYLPLRALSPLE